LTHSIVFHILRIQNAGAPNFEICNGWRNARLFAFKGFDSASKCLGPYFCLDIS